MSVSTKPPSGFRDFFGPSAEKRVRLIEIISEVYQSFGFTPLETPALENLNVLFGSGGDENEKLIFKVMKRGEKLSEALLAKDSELADFGLRFDLTVPLSRVVAEYRADIHLPWKVFHIASVWRAERAQKGRYREFIQCDVDIVGAKGISAEMEVIQAVATAVHAAGATGFELRLNDRRILQALAEKSGFGGEKSRDFFIALDKKDKVPAGDILNELREKSGQPVSAILEKAVVENLSLEEIRGFSPPAVVDEFECLLGGLKSLDLPLAGIVFDSSLARGMGYYTGPIFELRHPSAGYSLGGGGRYDDLIGRFTKQSLPACGFSIGFERLLLLLEENNKESLRAGLFIPIFSEDLRMRVLKLASKLRTHSSVDVYPDNAKLKHQLKYASDRKYRWVLMAGEDEFKSGQFKVKDFSTGEEKTYSEVELLDATPQFHLVLLT